MGRCLLLRVEDEEQSEYMQALFKHVTDKLANSDDDSAQADAEAKSKHSASVGASAAAGLSTAAVAAISEGGSSTSSPLSRVSSQAWIVYALYMLHETQPGEKHHIPMPEFLWRHLSDCGAAFSTLPFRDPALVLHRMLSLQMFVFCVDYPSSATRLDLNVFLGPIDGGEDPGEAKLMRKARRSGKMAFIDPATGKPARRRPAAASAIQTDDSAKQRLLGFDSTHDSGHAESLDLIDLSAHLNIDALRTVGDQYSTAVHAALSSSSAASGSGMSGLEGNIAAPAFVSAAPQISSAAASAPHASPNSRFLQHLRDSLDSYAQARAALASKPALSSSSASSGVGPDPLLHLAAASAAVNGAAAAAASSSAPSLLQFSDSMRRPSQALSSSFALHAFPPPPSSSSARGFHSLGTGSALLQQLQLHEEEHKAGVQLGAEGHVHPLLSASSWSAAHATGASSVEFALANIYAAAAVAAATHPPR